MVNSILDEVRNTPKIDWLFLSDKAPALARWTFALADAFSLSKEWVLYALLIYTSLCAGKVIIRNEAVWERNEPTVIDSFTFY